MLRDPAPLTIEKILELDALRKQLERLALFEALTSSRKKLEAGQLAWPMEISKREAAILGVYIRLHAVSPRLRCRLFQELTLGHLASHEEGIYGS